MSGGSAAPEERARFIGIFIMAFAAIAYQVLLTRIFSVILYYHYAFAGISLAMLGLTIGAEKIYLRPERFAPERFKEEWAKAALGFSLSSVLLVLFFIWLPLFAPNGTTADVLGAAMLLFIIPFTYSGICITLILTQSPAVGRLYAADLIGAASGCVGIVVLLSQFDPLGILFLISAFTAFAAWRMSRGVGHEVSTKARRIAIAMLAAFAVQGALYASGHMHLNILWAKSSWEGELDFERWNAYSRIRVIKLPVGSPFGWGFGRPQTIGVAQRYLDIDSDASTVINRFDGNLKPLSFLSHDVVNAGYHLRPVRAVAIIGVGGGRDILSALYFGATEILALEMNPAIISALKTAYADFTGHFTERPEVKLINAEARSWLTRNHPQMDLVQISLIDTWAATAAGGLTLSENRLYTLEAWKEFLSTLTPNGMLEVSRWYDDKTYRGEFYRLLSLAAESLKAMGVPQAEVRQHILAFGVDRIVTVVISKSPFTNAELAHAKQMAREENFNILISPDYALDETSRVIASGEATRAYYNALAEDVSAPTDDRPFFFYMKRFKNAFQPQTAALNKHNSSAVTIVTILLPGVLLLTIGLVIMPLVRAGAGNIAFITLLSDLLYFGGIGLGFMLVEISQMQRLTVFLGHPVYGLCVVLFTLLLFGGLGSATVHPEVRSERLWKRPLLLCLVLIATGWLTPLFASQFAAFDMFVRILVSILLLAPAGLCMGMMFPTGMALSSAHRHLQPWLWGINGAVSVLASILGMAISMQYGIAAAYWTGVGAYALCLLLAFSHRLRGIR